MAWKPDDIEKVFTEICRRISEEGYSIRKCLLDPEFPGSETFYKWLEDDPEKAKRYARACEEREILMLEDIIHIADDTTRDEKIVMMGDAAIVTIDKEHIQRSKVRIDARKYYLAVTNPKKYGNKVDVTSDGESIANMTPEQKDKMLATLLKKAQDLDGTE
ncbi:MAG TPA: hypothetical protein PK243_10605 [Flexilinea sp.]|nr:hypothetical protein [Flexilinea sp.]